MFTSTHVTCSYRTANQQANEKPVDALDTKKLFLQELARCCLAPSLCPHLNQVMKGQTWAREQSEGEPESPLL